MAGFQLLHGFKCDPLPNSLLVYPAITQTRSIHWLIARLVNYKARDRHRFVTGHRQDKSLQNEQKYALH